MNAPRGTRPPQVAEQGEFTPSQRDYLKLSLKLAEDLEASDDKAPHNNALLDFEAWDARARAQITEPPDRTNPKDLIGITKPNMFLVPPAAEIYMALAMQDGADKYGPYNWRENEVRASIYISALKRHIADWVDGQELAVDSNKPHLAHALACIAILVDAIETGNLVDDRPPPGAAAALIARWTDDKNA